MLFLLLLLIASGSTTAPMTPLLSPLDVFRWRMSVPQHTPQHFTMADVRAEVRRRLGSKWRSSFEHVMPMLTNLLRCIDGKQIESCSAVSLAQYLASVARVNGKYEQYTHWLGRMMGKLSSTFHVSSLALSSRKAGIGADLKLSGSGLLRPRLAGSAEGKLAVRRLLENREVTPRFPVLPHHPWFAMTAIFGLLFVAASVILGTSVRLWVHKKALVALNVLVVLALGLRVVYWTFRAVGFQFIGHSTIVPKSLYIWHVDIAERLGSVFVMLVVALFAFILLAAVWGQYFPARKSFLHLLSATLFGSVALVCAVYGVTMAVINAKALDSFVVDVSDVFLPAMLLCFSATLSTCLIFVTCRLSLGGDGASSAQSVRNSRIFLACSLCISALHLAFFVVSIVWFTFTIELSMARMGLKIASDLAVLGAVLIYLALLVRPTSSKATATLAATDAYAYVPLEYQDF